MMFARILLQNPPVPADTTTQWVLIGAAIVTMAYLFMRSSRRKKDPLEKNPYPSSLAQQRGVEREMQNLLVELSNMSRQISAQLDTRAAKLEELIRQADERIDALHRAAAVTTRPPDNGASYGAVPVSTPSTPPEIDPRHREVYDLIDQGRTPQEVSQQLNRPIGEIELILALRAR